MPRIALFAVLLALPFSVASWSATAISDQARAEALCLKRYFNGSLARKPFLHQTKMVNVFLDERMSQARFDQVRGKLQALGFKSLNRRMRPGITLTGELAPEKAIAASRIRGVRKVTREGYAESEIWTRGRKRTIETPADPEIADETKLWKQMPEPIRDFPPRDLATIRKLAREKGLTVVIQDRRPATEAEVREIEKLYGARVFFANDLPDGDSVIRIPGVVLHLAPNRKAFRVRGDLNPLLGHGDILALDKVSEYQWISAVDPKAMGRSLTGAELARDQIGLTEDRKRVASLIEEYLAAKGGSFPRELRPELLKLTRGYLDAADREFPKGAFIKWKDDYATREADNLLITDSITDAKLVDRYLTALKDAKSALKDKYPVRSHTFTETVNGSGDSAAAAIQSMIVRPGDILFQEKLPVAKTTHGNIMEFRADMLDGHVMNVTFRYGLEYFPEEAQLAKKFLERLMEKMTPEQKYFTGGWDLVMLDPRTQGGKKVFKVIESNPGTLSAFLDPGTYPVSGATVLSNFMGEPSPLLRALEKVYQSGPEAQARFLRDLPKGEFEVKESLAHLPVEEAVFWLRDRYLSDWRKRGRLTLASANDSLRKLQTALWGAGLGQDPDIQWAMSTASDFVYRVLSDRK